MPIYEYKCDKGHVFDVMQKMSDDPLRECVECGASVRKVMQPVGISFKGSGFYSTDYNGKKGPKTESAELGSKNGSGEGKPAEKSGSAGGSSNGSGESKPSEKSASAAEKASK